MSGMVLQRRTRIVATLGPATDPPGVPEALLSAGLDVVRVNYAHGSGPEHAARVARWRALPRHETRQLGVLADLPGPKLRVLLAGPLSLEPGQDVTAGRTAGADADFHVTEPELLDDLKAGQRVLLDDGRLQLRVLRSQAERIVLRVEAGGTLLPNKGANLPDSLLAVPALTSRDHAALAAAAVAGPDWLALSFVRSPDAADALRNAARSHGLDLPVLAKIERPEAVERSREIIEAFDGIMVARGDLGVEIPLEQVPNVQKRLIREARAAGKPVLTATDMLDSMRGSSRPTRAEVSDVASAVRDGSDALMLSAETAIGSYPVAAVTWMDRIAREAEKHFRDEERVVVVPHDEILDHVTHVTCSLAREVSAAAIIVPSNSGRAARLVARHRPSVPIVVPTSSEALRRRLALVWGLQTVPLDIAPQPGEDRLELVIRAAFTHGAVQSGDRVVVLAEAPAERGKRFPTIRVARVSESGGSCEP